MRGIFMPFFRWFSKRKTLYVEIQPTHIAYAWITTNNTKDFYLDKKITRPIESTCIIGNVIFKPTRLIKSIQSYIEEKKYPVKNIIISIPGLVQEQERKPFIIFQYALCARKSKLPITTIIDAPLGETPIRRETFFKMYNYLSLITNKEKKSPALWLFATIGTLTFLFMWIITIQDNIHIKNMQLRQESAELEHECTLLKKSIAAQEQLIKEKKSLEHLETIAQKYNNNNLTMTTPLSTLPNIMPSKLWLTAVKIGKHSSSNKQGKGNKLDHQKFIVFKGISPTTTEISAFVQELNKKNAGIQKPTLTLLTKMKQKQKKQNLKTAVHSLRRSYQFSVEGLI